MLNKGDKYLNVVYVMVLGILISCNVNGSKKYDRDQEIYDSAVKIIGNKKKYFELKTVIKDSIESWASKELGNWSIDDSIFSYQLDSLLCINTSETKLIGAVLTQYKIPDNLCGGLLFFYGVKIDSQWYFWSGESIFIPQEVNKNLNEQKPISFSQLHEQALNEVLAGYLTKDGEINDKWFESKFKDGYTPFEQRYKYKYILDGQRIDNEKQYYEYLWKRKGLILWITKLSKDSIAEINNLGREKLSRDKENEIRMAISRKMLAH